MKKILLSIYIIAGLLFCYSVFTENIVLRTSTKAIPLLVLIFAIKPNNNYNKYIFAGFVFSLFGDILLMHALGYFIWGLVAFLIAHLLYIKAFTKHNSDLKLLNSLPFYAFAGALSIFFAPYLKEMLIPVVVYMFVVATMVWRAFVQKNTTKISQFAFWGAVFFAFSDTNIAVAKFYYNYDYSDIVIIVSYWIAQYLIFLSVKNNKIPV